MLSEYFGFRLSQQERRVLRILALKEQRRPADLVRRLIRQAAQEAGLEAVLEEAVEEPRRG